MSHQDDRYTRDRDEPDQEAAQPGTPLEPDELPASPPEFSKQQAPRSEKAPSTAHPTTELSSTPKHSPGKPTEGKHPTAELHIKPKGRR